MECKCGIICYCGFPIKIENKYERPLNIQDVYKLAYKHGLQPIDIIRGKHIKPDRDYEFF